MRVLLALAAVGFLGELFPYRDFIEYWSAAKVLKDGGNPYDPQQLLHLQREALDKPDLEQPVLLWTPPWTLPVYLPFGFLPLNVAHLVWFLTQLGMFLLSVEMLWRAYGRPAWLRGSAWALVFLFSPVFWSLHFGQNTAFLLLGVSGFLYFRKLDRPMIAGAFAALTAIKPHLLAGFGVVLLLDAMTRSGRRTLFAGVSVITLGALIAWLANPNIFAQFMEALRRPSSEQATSLADWDVPLLSYKLRWLVNKDTFWIQFVPCLFLMLACAGYYLTCRFRRTGILPVPNSEEPGSRGILPVPCLEQPGSTGILPVPSSNQTEEHGQDAHATRAEHARDAHATRAEHARDAHATEARKPAGWNWNRELPRLVVLSVVLAPYGGWIFDMTLLLLPLFAGLCMLVQRRHAGATAAYVVGVLMVSLFALNIKGLADSLWLSPAVLGLYVAAEVFRAMRKPDPAAGTK